MTQGAQGRCGGNDECLELGLGALLQARAVLAPAILRRFPCMDEDSSLPKGGMSLGEGCEPRWAAIIKLAPSKSSEAVGCACVRPGMYKGVLIGFVG